MIMSLNQSIRFPPSPLGLHQLFQLVQKIESLSWQHKELLYETSLRTSSKRITDKNFEKNRQNECKLICILLLTQQKCYKNQD